MVIKFADPSACIEHLEVRGEGLPSPLPPSALDPPRDFRHRLSVTARKFVSFKPHFSWFLNPVPKNAHPVVRVSSVPPDYLRESPCSGA